MISVTLLDLFVNPPHQYFKCFCFLWSVTAIILFTTIGRTNSQKATAKSERENREWESKSIQNPMMIKRPLLTREMKRKKKKFPPKKKNFRMEKKRWKKEERNRREVVEESSTEQDDNHRDHNVERYRKRINTKEVFLFFSSIEGRKGPWTKHGGSIVWHISQCNTHTVNENRNSRSALWYIYFGRHHQSTFALPSWNSVTSTVTHLFQDFGVSLLFMVCVLYW